MVSSFEGNEDARFQQEVEQVKQWWQVRRLLSLPSLQLGVYARSGLTRVSPVASLQGSCPPVHRRAGRLEAWHARDPLPVQRPGQETARSPLSKVPRWKAQPHLRSVSLFPVRLAAPDVYAAEISLGRGPDPQ